MDHLISMYRIILMKKVKDVHKKIVRITYYKSVGQTM